jgi:hypothetical protein
VIAPAGRLDDAIKLLRLGSGDIYANEFAGVLGGMVDPKYLQPDSSGGEEAIAASVESTGYPTLDSYLQLMRKAIHRYVVKNKITRGEATKKTLAALLADMGRSAKDPLSPNWMAPQPVYAGPDPMENAIVFPPNFKGDASLGIDSRGRVKGRRD